MRKFILAVTLLTFTGAPAGAETITDPDAIAARLKFWATDPGDPVYYGEVRTVNAATKRIGGHYQCLALAFIKYEGGVFHYAHKMWSKSPDGSCHYDDVTKVKVGNHGACVKDSEAGFGNATGTARMTKANIDFANSRFRTVDTKRKRVGETAACIPPNGATAGLYSISIVDGRLRVITTRPLDYEVSIEVQDGKNPPTARVF
ncbi:hypothetical protein GCM10007301_18250 [Azorhizobium oxalatiphilum]|uniref:Uncharacterized protein n=1 Tax=Azorhizobium oxalatiphilum TaxID=980631 RepID=A0A917BWH4_9HYPH|nr:hypothetical protein [Azorhizobium oxalatiphilum]GGF58879.1 hypothetical protein GCM10007301_18250 [Azorhizobium oxalatiphilum]